MELTYTALREAFPDIARKVDEMDASHELARDIASMSPDQLEQELRRSVIDVTKLIRKKRDQ